MPSVCRYIHAIRALFACCLFCAGFFAQGIDPSAGAAQVWLVSTHGLNSDRQAASCAWKLQSYADGCWSDVPATSWRLFESPQRPLVVYVHGNHRDEAGAKAEGLLVLERLCTSAPADAEFDYLIWNWPSQELPVSFLHDARVKERRTVLEGRFLAKWLHQHANGRPQSLIGYSFGSAVVSGALHELALLADSSHGSGERGSRQAVLIGAAAGADWWSPRGRHCMALTQVDRMTVLINPQDWVLKLYPLLFRGHGPNALGAVGPSSDARWHPQAGEIEVVELPQRGFAAHDLPQYLSQAEFDCSSWPLALFAGLPGLADHSASLK